MNFPVYVIKTTAKPPRPDNDFFDRKGQYDQTLYNPERMHVGNDIPCPAGTPVRAFVAGTVVVSKRDKWLGNMVVVRDKFGRTWGSCHLTARKVSVGQKVTARTIIGTSGSTGNASGVHVHHFGCEDDVWIRAGWGRSPYFNTWPYLVAGWNAEWGKR